MDKPSNLWNVRIGIGVECNNACNNYNYYSYVNKRNINFFASRASFRQFVAIL